MRPDADQSEDRERTGEIESSAAESHRPDFFRPQGSPDWEAIGFDVLCSRCGYNLRTLTRPKCTECGLDFSWDRVLDKAGFRSSFLFEHHWQSRPLRSWFVTVWRSLRPTKFWKSISMHERVAPKPLAFMVTIAVLCFPIIFHGGAFLLHLFVYAVLKAMGTPRIIGTGRMGGAVFINNKYWGFADAMEGISKQPLIGGGTYIASILAIAAGLLFASFCVLAGLRKTLGRCRVRTPQVFRVMAYAATPICLMIPLMVLAVVALSIIFWSVPILPSIFEFLGYTSLVVIPGYYFSAGLKHYLHLPRPRILGFTAAFVAALTVLTGGTFIVAMFGGK